MLSQRRIKAKEILQNPVTKKRIFIKTITATQAREGIETSFSQAEAAYNLVMQEKRYKTCHIRTKNHLRKYCKIAKT